MNYAVQQYGINKGLTQNTVNTIYQDNFGYIWVGTQDGLNKFDGYKFIQYRKDPNNKFSLLDNFIVKIIGSKDSGLWIVTNDGLNKFHPKSNAFTPVLKNKHNQNSQFSIKIKNIIEGQNDILWLRTDEGFIEYHTSKNKFFEYLTPPETNQNISNDNNFSLVTDSNKNLWSGSGNGLIRFNLETKEIKVYSLNNSEVYTVYKISDDLFVLGTKAGAYYFYPETGQIKLIPTQVNLTGVKSILKDNSNILWLGSQYGLMYLDTLKNSIVPFSLENYISDELLIGDIETIIKDNSGIVWAGTNYGVFKIDSRNKLFNLYKKDKDNIPNFSSNSIFSIYFDPKNNLVWFGTRGYGLNVFNRNTNEVSVYNTSNSALKDNFIHSIKKGPLGNLWLGTENGVFILNPGSRSINDFTVGKNEEIKRFFVNNRITDIVFDDQIIWFSSFKGLLKYAPDNYKIYKNTGSFNSIIHDRIFKLLKQNTNKLWIATYSGVSVLDIVSESFTNYSVESGKISSNMVPYVFQSSDNTIWLGTGTGLNKYIPEKDSFIFYTIQSHNFNNDFIYTITEDSNKILWLSTNKGIISFNPQNEEVHNFSLIDNLQDYEYNVGAVYNAGDELFWGGTKGFNSLNPEKFRSRSTSPKPIITSFNIKYNTSIKNINPINLRAINLNWRENNFEINFSIPEYTTPENNTFKYRILEKDSSWTNLGNNHSITFFELSPGKYTFQLIGSTTDSTWNSEPLELIIVISSPWWFTTAAYIIYILLIAFIIGFFVFRHNREIRKENKILQEKQIVARQVEMQKELLSVKNTNIAESMRYASRIINALLPSKNRINKLINDYFILYMSKEIVSGDFYWFDQKNDKVIIAAADSTGHGIPGAFMSIIGMELLRNILIKGIDKPSDILDELNKGIASVFKNEEKTGEMKDGMDITIISIHKNENVIEFAGAVNQLYLLRDDNIVEIKGDRYPISPASYNQYGKFTNHVLQVEDNDMIYLFSDGYIDQFGGPDEKKFKYRRFRNMLLNNYMKSADEQEKILKRVINSWRGNLEQVDDIMVLGIRIHTKKD
jgi:ligand-binding sensor domain-containing protein/serine phosphatase RsbU (regulator of sigma subunit)